MSWRISIPSRTGRGSILIMLEDPFNDGCFIIANLILIFSSKAKSIFMDIAFGSRISRFYRLRTI